MEKNKFKVGDIVRFYDDNNNKYRVLEIKEDGTLATESLISGNKYFFQQCQVELVKDKLKVGDIVRHTGFPGVRYEVAAIKEDGVVEVKNIQNGIKILYDIMNLEKEYPRRQPVMDMNNDILKLGDIVRIYDSPEYHKITEINFKDKLVRLSTLDGDDKGMYGGGALKKVRGEDSDKSMSKSEVISYDGFSLKIGDAVKIHDDTSGSVYYITELNLVNRDWYAKLKDKDDYNHGFFNTSELELVTDGASNLCGKDGSGKDDRADGKPRWELLPLDAIEEIVKVYTMGAEKYADDAWKTIPDAHRRYLAALFRHVAAYERGERLDKESGLSHLAHAAWNAIAILWLDMHKDDKSDE